MLNKDTRSSVGDYSPRVGSSCLAAPEHGTGHKAPRHGVTAGVAMSVCCSSCWIMAGGTRERERRQNDEHPVIGYGRRKENTGKSLWWITFVLPETGTLASYCTRFYMCGTSHQPLLEPKYIIELLSFHFLVHKPDEEMSFCLAFSYTHLILLWLNTMDNVELIPCHEM